MNSYSTPKSNLRLSCSHASPYFPSPARRAERMPMAMSAVVESVSKKPIAPHVRALVFELCCNDEQGEDVEVPFVQYRLPRK